MAQIAMKSNMNINGAIRIMKAEVKDEIAIAYLNSLEECIDDYGTRGMVVQLNYVLCNLSSWRGPQAREVKAFVKTWIMEKRNAESITMG